VLKVVLLTSDTYSKLQEFNNMPASGGDPVTAALSLSLTASQGPKTLVFIKDLSLQQKVFY
jgi:hypothetical protein